MQNQWRWTGTFGVQATKSHELCFSLLRNVRKIFKVQKSVGNAMDYSQTFDHVRVSCYGYQMAYNHALVSLVYSDFWYSTTFLTTPIVYAVDKLLYYMMGDEILMEIK